MLASADTVEEAAAVLKQVLALLGYESEVARRQNLPQQHKEDSFIVSPSGSPQWSVMVRRAAGAGAKSGSDEELVAKIACEVFGAVASALESRSRITDLEERIKASISSLHHDVRTPITSIAGMAQTLLMRPSVNEKLKREFLERIEISADTITAMVDEFRAGFDAMLAVAARPAEANRLDEIFLRAIHDASSRGADITMVAEPQRPLVVEAASGVVAEILGGIVDHFASVLAGKGVAGLREAPGSKPDASQSRSYARMILKGPAFSDYSLPPDLAKVWVPEGSLVSNDQYQRLARPYHLSKALGGTLEIYEDSGELVIELTLPLSD